MDLDQILTLDADQLRQLSKQEVIALQTFLQAQGIDIGSVDGDPGSRTQAGLNALKARQASQQSGRDAAALAQQEAQNKAAEIELEKARLQAQQQNAAREQQNAQQQQQTAQQAEEQARSLPGILTQAGVNIGAPTVGYLGGREIIGRGVNKMADFGQRQMNEHLKGLAEDRVAGLTTREGARFAAERAGAIPARNAFIRNLGRMSPHLLTGALTGAKGGLLYSQIDENDPQTKQNIDTASALGLLGAGTGIAEQGIAYAKGGGVPPDARALAVIESNQLRRNAPKLKSAPLAIAPPDQIDALKGAMSRNELQAKAKSLGLPVSGNKSAIASRIVEATSTAGKAAAKAIEKTNKALLPLAAGYSAYDAITSPSEAAGPDAQPTMADQAMGVAGGLGAAGGAYGVQQGLQALMSKLAPTALGRAIGAVSGPAGLMYGAYEGSQALAPYAQAPEAQARFANQQRVLTQPGGYAAEAARRFPMMFPAQ